MLLQAVIRLPKRCEALDLFQIAYLYRRQFEYLAESEPEEDSGLVSAVSRALSLSLDFGLEDRKVYASCDRGIDTISWDFLKPSLSDNFKWEICRKVPQLPDYTISIFFDSLGRAEVDYQNSGKLQLAVAESLQNYARTATIGTIELEEHTARDSGLSWIGNSYDHFADLNAGLGGRYREI